MSLIPEVWDIDLLATLKQHIEYGNPLERRKGHTEVTPYTDAELRARDEAVAEWEKLTEELINKGWLEETYDGTFPATETEHREWVYDETVEEHQARVNPTGEATYTFKVVDR